MSWRADGRYSGLTQKDQAFLTRFNKNWDSKSGGRSQKDAYECLTRCGLDHINLHQAPHVSPSDKVKIEAELIKLASKIIRVAVPRRTRAGQWSLNTTMSTGEKARVKFDHEDEATQAYYSLRELTLWFSGT